MMEAKRPEKKKKRIWLVPAVTVVVIVLAGIFLIYQGIQKKQAVEDAIEEYALDHDEYDTDETIAGTISWNDKLYKYNDHISNFLFLGIDNRELVDTEIGQADAGQSDAIFLLAWDRIEKDLTLIFIPRDTMTEFDFYSTGSQEPEKVKYHLNLAYAYGDGKHESCKNTAKAVSNLFYGLNIQGYCALAMDGLPVLMEEMDGLTVTIPNNSLESKDPEYKEGTELVLDADNVETFVRYRDISVSQSALMRMERQEIFLKAYLEQSKKKFEQDAGFITRLYTAIGPYMVTNMGNDQFVKLMESAVSGGKLNEWTVPGKGVEGEVHDEYYVDDDALYEKIMETFYVEVE